MHIELLVKMAPASAANAKGEILVTTYVRDIRSGHVSGGGRRRILTDSEREERKRSKMKRMCLRRIYLGHHHTRVMQIKEQFKFKSCLDVMQLLFDRYDDPLCIGIEHERWTSLAKLTNLTDEQLAGVLLDCYEQVAGGEIPWYPGGQEPAPVAQKRPEKQPRKTPHTTIRVDWDDDIRDPERTSCPMTQIWDDDSGDSSMESDNDNVSASYKRNQNDSSKEKDNSNMEDVITGDVKRCSNEIPDGIISVKTEVEDDGYDPYAIVRNPVQSNHMYSVSEIEARKMGYSEEFNDDDDNNDDGSDFTESEKDDLEFKDDEKGDPDFVLMKTGEKRGPYVKKHHKASVENVNSKNSANISHKSRKPKKGLRVKYVEESKKRSLTKIAKGFFRLDDQRGSVLSKQFLPYLEVVHKEDTSPANSLEQVFERSEHSTLDSPVHSCEVNDKDANIELAESLGSSDVMQSPTCAGDTYRCKICGVTSKSLSSIRYHVRRVELYDPCMCSECGEMLPNKSQLAYHKRSTHNDMFVLKKYRCSYEDCSVTNKSPSEIRKHIAAVHENRRDYPCTWEECGKCFKDAYALKVHMRIHNDDKPIVCYLCGFRCRQKASLNWHMKTKHPADTETSAEDK